MIDRQPNQGASDQGPTPEQELTPEQKAVGELAEASWGLFENQYTISGSYELSGGRVLLAEPTDTYAGRLMVSDPDGREYAFDIGDEGDDGHATYNIVSRTDEGRKELQVSAVFRSAELTGSSKNPGARKPTELSFEQSIDAAARVLEELGTAVNEAVAAEKAKADLANAAINDLIEG